MKKINLALILLLCLQYHQSRAQEAPDKKTTKEMKSLQPRFGVKLGYNVARLSGATPNFTPKAVNGFNASIFYAPVSKGVGYRTELIFSRQGFAFDQDGKRQNLSQDYVYMPHLTTLTIAQRVQLQAGGQVGYLLHTKKETAAETTPAGTASSEEQKAMDFMNRLDYGATVGLEIYPYKGLIIGGRYNVSMGNFYKQAENLSSPSAASVLGSFLPVNPADFKGKNAVIQLSIGYRF